MKAFTLFMALVVFGLWAYLIYNYAYKVWDAVKNYFKGIKKGGE
jgi:hypothetical protein